MSKYRNQEPERLALAFKALAHPHRLRMYLRLISCCAPGTVFEAEPAARTCVGDLGGGLAIAPSTVSHHLKELRRAGLVRMRRRGRHIDCWVDPEMVAALATVFLPAGDPAAVCCAAPATGPREEEPS